MPFSEILGHDRQKQLLCASLTADRLPSCYLFSGPEGIGKKLLARAFIKMILCTLRNACKQCRNCRQYDHGNHPDAVILDNGDSAIKIEDIRALQKQLQFKPIEAEKRVCLIDNADKMTLSAQTALLKSLEEPKLHTLFILISAHPEALLATVRSRCQSLRFNRLPPHCLREKLAAELGDEEASAAAVLAFFAAGSLKNIAADRRNFYLRERREILLAFSSLPSPANDPQQLFALARKLAAKTAATADILEILKLFFRDVLFRLEGQNERFFVNSDLTDLVKKQSEKDNIPSTLKKLEALREIEDALNRNTNPQLSFEVLLMRLTDPPKELASIRTV